MTLDNIDGKQENCKLRTLFEKGDILKSNKMQDNGGIFNA
jgi:hypothetical protein